MRVQRPERPRRPVLASQGALVASNPFSPPATPLTRAARLLGRIVMFGLLVGPASAAGEGGRPGKLPADLTAPDVLTGSEAIPAPAPDPLRDTRWCRLCHDGAHLEPTNWKKTAHGEQVCRDCHSGYHFNPHLPVDLGPEAATTNEGATPEKRRAAAWQTCQPCHEDDVPAAGVKHGDRLPGAEGTPTCRDCHGEPHEIVQAETLSATDRRRSMNQRCTACHASEERMQKGAKPGAEVPGPETVAAYDHSVHGRKLDLGSERAPGCVDCHGGHEHKDLKNDGATVCRECHSSADADFVTLGDHRPFTREARPVSFFTLKFFGWLTFLTIFALSLHVLLDVWRSVRVILARRRSETPGGES